MLSKIKETAPNRKIGKKTTQKLPQVFIGFGRHGLSDFFQKLLFDFMKNKKFNMNDTSTKDDLKSFLEYGSKML